MDMFDIVTVAAEVVAGASVVSLGLAKVFPKFAKFGPVLTAVHKLLSLLALNHDKPDPGPAKSAVGKAKLVRDPKSGKVIGFKVRK